MPPLGRRRRRRHLADEQRARRHARAGSRRRPSLPTNAFGSLIVDANDASGNTLYAGSGEPNGSGDSEAGLGLFKSTDGGQSWSLVAGSQAVAINRSIGAIAVKPGAPGTIYIGTDVARHGSSAVERRPPHAAERSRARRLQVDRRRRDLRRSRPTWPSKTPPNPAPPASGVDWFQGGITKLEFDPNNADAVYAAVVGYGLWRSNDGGTTWRQVFQTMNPADTFGDRVEFDAVDLGAGKTRIYLGDSSDDLLVARVWRTDDAASIAGSPTVGYSNAGWTELSSSTNGTNGFLAYDYCQNGQCGYDDFVVSPAGQPGVGAGHANELWLGGSMNYDELRGVRRPAASLQRPRGDPLDQRRRAGPGRHLAGHDRRRSARRRGTRSPEGIHPDQHAVVFNPADTGHRVRRLRRRRRPRRRPQPAERVARPARRGASSTTTGTARSRSLRPTCSTASAC